MIPQRGTILKCVTGAFHGLEADKLYVCLKSEEDTQGFVMITLTEGKHTIRYSINCFEIIVEA